MFSQFDAFLRHLVKRMIDNKVPELFLFKDKISFNSESWPLTKIMFF